VTASCAVTAEIPSVKTRRRNKTIRFILNAPGTMKIKFVQESRQGVSCSQR
jgi:hypothetical protein